MLNSGRRRFAPGPAATLAMLVAVAAGIALGRWQLDRAAEKRQLHEGFARGDGTALALPAGREVAPRYQRVRARGGYDAERQFLMDNMTHEGRAGFHVLTPLRLNDGRIVIVNRGWIPLGPTRGWLPDLAVDTGPRSVTGRLDSIPRPPLELIAPPPLGWPRVVNYPRMEQLEESLGREVHPQVILLDAGEPDGYLREWRPPGIPPERHFGYAVQWFALAATAFGIWLVTGTRRTGGPLP